MINKINYRSLLKGIALILILYGNMCFYKLETQTIYLFMLVIAGVFVLIATDFKYFRLPKPVIWLTIIFSIFILYGEFYLVTGIFNTDRFIISYYQCIIFYSVFSTFLKSKNTWSNFLLTFGIAALLCITTIYIQEGSFIGRELRSVGSSMAGNVNTVGMCLGVMSIFIVFCYTKSKNIFILLFSCLVMVIMSLTGSKKTIVYIIANVFIIYNASKNKAIGKLILIILLLALAYVIFGTSYFYNLIGSRVIDMLGQFGFKVENAHYSYSTEIRIEMIREAFLLWMKKPIFGGGTNYFQANTVTIYEYSHCNVTEILCSFGIVGLFIYYIPHIMFLKNYKKISEKDKSISSFCLIILILSIFIDWMAVTYSSFATMYIPIIFSFCIMDNYFQKRKIMAVNIKNYQLA